MSPRTGESALRLEPVPPLASWRNLALAAGTVALGTAAILAGIGLMAVAGLLISRAAGRPPILDLVLLFVAVRLFGLARPALRYAERLVSHELTFRLLAWIRHWFVAALQPLSAGQLAAFRSGDLLSRLSADVDAVQESVLRIAAPTVVALLVSTAVVAALAVVDSGLALLIAALLVWQGFAASWLSARESRRLGDRAAVRRRELSADLVSVLQAIDDVRAAGAEQRIAERLASHQAALDAGENRHGWRQAGLAGLSMLGTGLALLGALTLTAAAAAGSRLDAVLVAAIVLGTIAAFESVEALPAAWLTATQTLDSARRVRDVARTPPAVVEPPAPVVLALTAAPPIALAAVDFDFGASPVLRGVNLRIDAGERLGLEGATGSGKSTLLALLSRDWDPRAGEVTIDGRDLRSLTLASLRHTLVVLPQQVHVFATTLAANLRLARPAATDAQLRDALGEAALGSLLDRLPDGLDTWVGEHGARLSAGERQRVGIARVLLSDARVALLDEPTAHLDAPTERSVVEALGRWSAGRTLVVASHAPGALALAARRVRLEGGRVREV